LARLITNSSFNLNENFDFLDFMNEINYLVFMNYLKEISSHFFTH
jgi:hypothetical protein